MESARPGVAAGFRLPDTSGDQALLNAARAFAEAAVPLQNEFVRHVEGLPRRKKAETPPAET